mmetsp:Transcript_24036/g.37440  ORF Transcript_24036/g.37440 Transcript_24036/m.37440 type:complete len:224 (-) Transcript_24036:54-725(-)
MHLGKVNKDSFSQQTLMEMVVDGIENKSQIYDDSSSDISTWNLVMFNESHEVVEISWSEMGLKGSVNLEWLPPTTCSVNLWWNCLKGSLHLGSLPETLVDLNASDNAHSGDVSLEALPNVLERLNLSFNGFTGSVDLNHLPTALQYLHLNNNEFCGAVCLINLPSALTEIFLNRNRFSGFTDFSNLPKNLRILGVAYTQIEGTIESEEGKSYYVSGSLVKLME